MDTNFSLKRCKIILSLFFTTILFGQSVDNKILDNEKLRFGIEDANPVYSISSTTHLNRPFYKTSSGNYLPLTKSGTPLNYGIKIGGDGTEEWNSNGFSAINSNVTNQHSDYSQFITTVGNSGYGVVVSKGDIDINGTTLEIENRYTLDLLQKYVKIEVKITNKSTQPVTNVRYFVGTPDDFLGTTENTTKRRGNFSNGSWNTISSQSKRSRALNLSTNNSESLFLYTTHPKSNTIIHTNSNDFDLVTKHSPALSGTQVTTNGGYALYARLNDLNANGGSDQFTWYYAAGASSIEYSEIISEISKESGFINAVSIDNVTFNIQSKADNSTAYYLVVPSGSPIPTKEQIKSPTNYSVATPTTSGNLPITVNQVPTTRIQIKNLNSDTEYELYYLTQNALGEYSNITTILFKTRPAFDFNIVQTKGCYGANNGSLEITFNNTNDNYTYFWERINETTSKVENLGPGSYTVRVTNSTGHTVTKETTLIEQNQIDKPSVDNQTFCSTATVANLPQEDEDGTYKWYNIPDGGTALTLTTILTSNTYYVSRVNDNQCESKRTAVQVIINPIPNAPVVTNQTFCSTATVANLPQANGTYKWYNTQSGGTALADTTLLTNDTYYVSQYTNLCESERTPVQVLVNTIPSAPILSNYIFCDSATVADLPKLNGRYKWYNTQSGGTALADSIVLTNTTYYVSEYTSLCESERTAVQVLVNTRPTAPIVANQIFCNGATVSDLPQSNNGNYKWYSSSNSNTPLTNTTILVTDTYYVGVTTDSCESVRTAVQVIINPIPNAPVIENQSFCNLATVADLPQGNGNYIWYSNATATTPLNLSEILISGTYYSSQITNGCESIERTAVNVYTNLGALIKMKWNDVLVFDNTSGIYNTWQWYKDGVSIPGANKQYYSTQGSLTGTFYVIATNNNGDIIQTCPYIPTQAKNIGEISIIPNPVLSGQNFNMEVSYTNNDLKDAQIIITDLSGRLIFKINDIKQKNVLYAPSSSGVYIVVLQLSNGNRKTTKLIVK